MAGSNLGRRLRQTIMGAHTWMGRVVVLYLGVMFLTGTVLVFGDELESLAAPQMRAAPAAGAPAFGAALDAVQAHYPDARILNLGAPTAPWMAAPVRLQSGNARLVVWTDPATGAVQGQTPLAGFREMLRQVHTLMIVPTPLALLAVTSLAFPLLWQLASGLYSYRRFWRGLLRWPGPGQAGRGRWGMLHRLAGLWVLPLLLVIGLTSLSYFVEALGIGSGLPPAKAPVARSAALPADFDGAALDRAVTLARETLPGLEVQEIGLPLRPNEPVVVRGQLTAWLVRARANAVSIDPVTFEVLGAHRGEDLSLYRRQMEAADPLHFGLWGGQVSRVLWLASGLMSLLLIASALKIVAFRRAPSTGGLRAAWSGIAWPWRILSGLTLAVALLSLVARLVI